MKIFGIDILKGSVRSRSKRPKYALVKYEDGEIISEESASQFRLLRLVAAEKPDILAVDSLQEIGTSTPDIYLFLEHLPIKTALVCVTGGEKKTGLVQVAARYNISFDKFDPFAEARVIAEVAYRGSGAKVIAFEKETEIVVSRNRSPGKGGWSQNRYARKIHGHVLRKSREIEENLKSSGIRYKKSEYKAFGGVSRVVFSVFGTRDEIPVSAGRGGDVQVKISGKRLDRIRFEPLSTKPRYLIVGIDPGTTIGIAALDFEGNPVCVISSRQMTMADVIETLYTHGKPVVVASDVSQMPFTVEKIRRAFNAVAYTPGQDISVGTKYELTSTYSYENDHQRDALTAALEAFKYWDHKFSSIYKRVPQGYDLDEVKAGYIRGLSLEQIISSFSKKPEKTGYKRPDLDFTPIDERVRVLDGMVKQLRFHNDELTAEVDSLKTDKQKLVLDIEKLRSSQGAEFRKDVEIIKRDSIIQNLKKKLRKEEKTRKKLMRRLKKLKEFENKAEFNEGIPVKVLKTLTKDSLRVLDEGIGIKKGDVLYVNSPEDWGAGVVKELAATGILCVIIPERVRDWLDSALKNLFLELSLPLLFEADTGAKIAGMNGRVKQEELDTAISAWEDEIKDYMREQKEEMLDGIFKEYLAERGREVKKNG